MRKTRLDSMNCSIAKALDQVGEWWSLLIVRECTQGSTRFDEFQAKLGIARNILTSRLERLVELEILERYPLQERAGAFGYRLTPKGEELYPVLVSLHQWGDKWLTNKPPVTFVDNTTNEPIEKVSVRGPDGRELSFRDVRFTPGPGATATTHAVIEDRNKRVIG
jgi:DNA-binding HxlR family transcriptional regulator